MVHKDLSITKINLDVLKEVREMMEARQEHKEFFKKLDSQGLLFETYIYAVMGKFQCDSKQAAEYIAEYLKEE